MRAEIDFLQGLTSEFIDAQRFKNAFKRLWGTTTIDGVEVFNKEFKIYKGTQNDNVQEFLGLIGAKDQVNSAEFKGVTRVWFEVNPDRLSGSYYDDLVSEIVEQRIDNLFPLGREFDVSLNTVIDSINDPEWLDMSASQRKNYVRDNFDDIFNSDGKVYLRLSNNRTILTDRTVEVHGDIELEEEETSGNEIHELSKYILKTGAVNFDIQAGKVTVQAIPRVRYHTYGGGAFSSGRTVEIKYFEYHIACEFKFERTAATDEDGELVQGIMGIEKAEDQAKIAASLAYERSNSVGDGLGRRTIPTVTNALFYKSHLRAELVDNANMKSLDFKKTVLRGLKTEYRKKKTKWYKKVIAIVIVIVVAVVTRNLELALEVYLAVVAAALAGISAILANLGYEGIANYTSKFSKGFSIAATIVGLYNIANNFAKSVVAEAAAREAAVTAVQMGTDVGTEAAVQAITGEAVSITIGDVANVVFDGVMSSISSFSGVVGKLNMVAGFYMKNELQEIQNANNSLQKQVEKQEEELFMLSEQEFGFGLINSPEFARNLYQPLDRIEQSYNVDWRYAEKGNNIA